MAAPNNLDNWRSTLSIEERNEKRGKILEFLSTKLILPQYSRNDLSVRANQIEEAIFSAPSITNKLSYIEAIAKKMYSIQSSYEKKQQDAAAAAAAAGTTPSQQQPQTPITPITPITPMTPVSNQQPSTPIQQQQKQVSQQQPPPPPNYTGPSPNTATTPSTTAAAATSNTTPQPRPPPNAQFNNPYVNPQQPYPSSPQNSLPNQPNNVYNQTTTTPTTAPTTATPAGTIPQNLTPQQQQQYLQQQLQRQQQQQPQPPNATISQSNTLKQVPITAQPPINKATAKPAPTNTPQSSLQQSLSSSSSSSSSQAPKRVMITNHQIVTQKYNNLSQQELNQMYWEKVNSVKKHLPEIELLIPKIIENYSQQPGNITKVENYRKRFLDFVQIVKVTPETARSPLNLDELFEAEKYLINMYLTSLTEEEQFKKILTIIDEKPNDNLILFEKDLLNSFERTKRYFSEAYLTKTGGVSSKAPSTLWFKNPALNNPFVAATRCQYNPIVPKKKQTITLDSFTPEFKKIKKGNLEIFEKEQKLCNNLKNDLIEFTKHDNTLLPAKFIDNDTILISETIINDNFSNGGNKSSNNNNLYIHFNRSQFSNNWKGSENNPALFIISSPTIQISSDGELFSIQPLCSLYWDKAENVIKSYKQSLFRSDRITNELNQIKQLNRYQIESHLDILNGKFSIQFSTKSVILLNKSKIYNSHQHQQNKFKKQKIDNNSNNIDEASVVCNNLESYYNLSIILDIPNNYPYSPVSFSFPPEYSVSSFLKDIEIKMKKEFENLSYQQKQQQQQQQQSNNDNNTSTPNTPIQNNSNQSSSTNNSITSNKDNNNINNNNFNNTLQTNRSIIETIKIFENIINKI